MILELFKSLFLKLSRTLNFQSCFSILLFSDSIFKEKYFSLFSFFKSFKIFSRFLSAVSLFLSKNSQIFSVVFIQFQTETSIFVYNFS